MHLWAGNGMAGTLVKAFRFTTTALRLARRRRPDRTPRFGWHTGHAREARGLADALERQGRGGASCPQHHARRTRRRAAVSRATLDLAWRRP
jgi:hypothetical protein